MLIKHFSLKFGQNAALSPSCPLRPSPFTPCGGKQERLPRSFNRAAHAAGSTTVRSPTVRRSLVWRPHGAQRLKGRAVAPSPSGCFRTAWTQTNRTPHSPLPPTPARHEQAAASAVHRAYCRVRHVVLCCAVVLHCIGCRGGQGSERTRAPRSKIEKQSVSKQGTPRTAGAQSAASRPPRGAAAFVITAHATSKFLCHSRARDTATYPHPHATRLMGSTRPFKFAP